MAVGDDQSDGSMLPDDDTHTVAAMSRYDGLQELYIDRLLTSPDRPGSRGAESPCLQGRGVFGVEYSLTFFSDARLSALAAQLGHDRVSQVRARVASVVAERMRTIERVPAPATDADQNPVLGMDESLMKTYIHCKPRTLGCKCKH